MNRTLRDLLLVLLLILLMVGALAWYVWFRPKAPLSNLSTSNSTSSNIPAVPSPPLHVTDSGQYYEADLEYPSATPLAQTAGAAASAAAVAAMKNYDVDAIATFKKNTDVANITPQVAEDQGLNQYNKYDLTNSYLLFTSPTTVSYVFTMNEDTLGAHPNSYFQTFTFDSKTGTLLQLSNLFTPGADYLDKLSTLTRAMLTAEQGSSADPTFIDPGTTASTTNFVNFALDGDDLLIFFAPYQVAPYSSGPQTVQIPLSELGSLLQNAYQ